MENLDLNKLQSYYRAGYGPTGKPNDNYYLADDRGLMSLQAYITEQAFSKRRHMRDDRFMQEVTCEGTQYTRTSVNEEQYMSNLRKLAASQFMVSTAEARSNDPTFLRGFISTVYDNQWDKEVWLDCMIQDKTAYPQLRDSFKAELINRMNGQNDSMTEAAFYAYSNVLAKDSRVFASGDVDAANTVMCEAVRDYANRVVSDVDAYPNQAFVENETVLAAEQGFAEGYNKCEKDPNIHKEFNRLMNFLQKGIWVDMSTSGRSAYIVTESEKEAIDAHQVDLAKVQDSSASEEMPVSMMTDNEVDELATILTSLVNEMDGEEFDEELFNVLADSISEFTGNEQKEEVQPQVLVMRAIPVEGRSDMVNRTYDTIPANDVTDDDVVVDDDYPDFGF